MGGWVPTAWVGACGAPDPPPPSYNFGLFSLWVRLRPAAGKTHQKPPFCPSSVGGCWTEDSPPPPLPMEYFHGISMEYLLLPWNISILTRPSMPFGRRAPHWGTSGVFGPLPGHIVRNSAKTRVSANHNYRREWGGDFRKNGGFQ